MRVSGKERSKATAVMGYALAALPALAAAQGATSSDAGQASAAPARRDYTIPAGSLSAALEPFTRQSGLAVTVGDANGQVEWAYGFATASMYGSVTGCFTYGSGDHFLGDGVNRRQMLIHLPVNRVELVAKFGFDQVAQQIG